MDPVLAGAAADYESKKSFSNLMLLAFKHKNITEGINAPQAIWLHAKMRALQVNLPPQMGGLSCSIDVLNMALAGDAEAACIALQFCEVDDMSQPYHWFNDDRRDWLVNNLKEFLGWP